MRHLDLFSGIGGFALAAKTVWGADYECAGFCDNNPFCQAVLKKRFPGVPVFGDIRALGSASLADGHGRAGIEEINAGEAWQQALGHVETGIDLITGGFPCQPFSQAGRRKGKADDRYLWPEMLRVIKETQPRWVLGENVAGIISMALRQVLADLEAAHYETRCFVVPACAVNAPHRRDRVWIVAHRTGGRCKEHGPQSEQAANVGEHGMADAPDTASERNKSLHDNGDARPDYGESSNSWHENWPEVAAHLCRVDDGLPARVDGLELSKSRHRVERLKALGNAIVPQVTVEIMKAIRDTDMKEKQVR